MRRVVKLQTRKQVEHRQAAAGAAVQLELLPDEVLRQLPMRERQVIPGLVRALMREGRNDDEGLWPGGYGMYSRNQLEFIRKELRKLTGKDRRQDVYDAFLLLLTHIRQDTGEITLSRQEFADELGILPRHVSSVMGTLERLGVVRRERAGQTVTYYVNPDAAWNGSLDIRKREAAKAKSASKPPSLHAVQSGKA